MRAALAITAALFLVLLIPAWFGSDGARRSPGLPWEVTVAADGSTRVFGLVPGRSVVEDAIAAFDATPQIAVVGQRDAEGSLEAFFDGIDLGGIAGKVVVTARADREAIAGLRARAAKVEYMESATLRATLAEADLAYARLAPIRAITFAPGARLDDGIVRARFGAPARQLTDTAGTTHYLYPALGLDIGVGTSGKALLQYVAPADFALLSTPLEAGR